jgi:hypothetical protein
MNVISENLTALKQEMPQGVLLIAVSKTKPVALLQEAYQAGQRAFGENYVQELVEKQPQLPADIDWHFIGHLQSNKVKYIAPFVKMIHGVDSFSLLILSFLVLSSCSVLQTINEDNNKKFVVNAHWVQDTLRQENSGFRKINRMSPILYKNSVVVGNAYDGLVSYNIETKNKNLLHMLMRTLIL